MLSARELNSDEPAEPQLDQRAAHLHARLRPDARSGEPGDAGGAAGAVHQGPAAAVDRRPEDRRADASTTASCRTITSSSRRARASSTTRGATTTSTRRTTGTGGVPISSLFRRCSSASASDRSRRCSASDITTESRVHVPPAARRSACATIAPFLRYDADPYLVIADGRLVWVQDAYTDQRPVSVLRRRRRTASTTSATRSRSTIDAYHGTVALLPGRRRPIRSR